MRMLDDQIENLQKRKAALMSQYEQTVQDEQTATKTVLELHDESTAELEDNIQRSMTSTAGYGPIWTSIRRKRTRANMSASIRS